MNLRLLLEFIVRLPFCYSAARPARGPIIASVDGIIGPEIEPAAVGIESPQSVARPAASGACQSVPTRLGIMVLENTARSWGMR